MNFNRNDIKISLSPHLLVGDINSHHRTWDAHGIPDGSGDRISEWCAMNAYSCANDPEIPTRLHAQLRGYRSTSKHRLTSLSTRSVLYVTGMSTT